MKQNSILKQKIEKAIGRALSTNEFVRIGKERRKLIKRMGIISPRTFIGGMWIGRNELCYCGSKKKFKRCCWSKHAVLPRDKRTPETAKFAKKIEAYFNKNRRLPE